ncbi:hypothetical protein O6H91_05G122100 [Diphasiastrum complanatum]|uniref:Uncharacterized protein n=1 Tax=Diphasiastrum complanatum TaxID=34168 RepID=A0ACC2DST2_DIPCM|nr:hypothetical protein O6H91_05G122100 [Diphasiastrum complanatum]
MQAFSELVETWARAACIKKHHNTTSLISPRLDTAALLEPRDPPTITAPIDALVQLCGDQHLENKEGEEEESVAAGIATAAALLRMGDAKVAEAVQEVETGPYSYGHATSFEAVAGLLWVAITRARICLHTPTPALHCQ